MWQKDLCATMTSSCGRRKLQYGGGGIKTACSVGNLSKTAAQPIDVIHAVIVLVDHPPHVTKDTEIQQQTAARSVTSDAESATDSAIQQGPNSVPNPTMHTDSVAAVSGPASE